MRSVLPKIISVILAVCSVGIMGASIAAYYGRPDARAEMIGEDLSYYDFSKSTGETVTWTVTERLLDSQDTVGTFDNEYAAVAAARKHRAGKLSSQAAAWSQRTSDIRTQIQAISVQQEQDVKALNDRIATVTQVAAQYDTQLRAASQQLQKLSVDSKITRDETAKRREDVVRLQNELEEVRTDLFRLQELRRTLTDRLVRLQLENDSLKRRRDQLQGQL